LHQGLVAAESYTIYGDVLGLGDIWDYVHSLMIAWEANGNRKEGGNTGEGGVGNGVRSHPVTRAVPSALVSLTAGFGMGPGVPSRL